MRVKIKSFGIKFKIDINSYDTIQQVKQKIKEAHDIEVNEQELYLGGRKLVNEKTVSYYNIEEKDEINLLQIRTGGFQIFIIGFDGRNLELQVRSSYTIRKVKESIYEELGVPLDKQRLIFGGYELENEKTLSNYGVVSRNSLNLVTRVHGGFI